MTTTELEPTTLCPLPAGYYWAAMYAFEPNADSFHLYLRKRKALGYNQLHSKCTTLMVSREPAEVIVRDAIRDSYRMWREYVEGHANKADTKKKVAEIEKRLGISVEMIRR